MLQNDTHIKLQLLGCLQNTQFNINIKRLRVGYIKILGTLCIFLYIYNSSNCDTSRWVGKQSGLELCLWYPQTSHSLPMLFVSPPQADEFHVQLFTGCRISDQMGTSLPRSHPRNALPEQPHSYPHKGAAVGALAFQVSVS